MIERNKQVVLKFIQAMGRSDPEAAAECLDEKAFAVAKGFGKFAGVRRHETMVSTIDAFSKLLPTGLCPEVLTVTAEAERVVVEWEGRASTVEGKNYCNQYCMVFFMRDGKILQVNEYFCNVLANEVLWPLVSQHDQASKL